MITNYAIRRISLLSAFRFGFVIGSTLLLIPGFLLGLGLTLVASWLYTWLQSWAGIRGLGINLNPLDLLQLTDFMSWLKSIVALNWLLIPIVAFLVIVLGGVAYGLSVVLSASTYNFLATLSGGLVVELEEVNKPAHQRQSINPVAANLASVGQAQWPAVGQGSTLPPTQLAAAGVAHATLQASTGQSWALSPQGAILGSTSSATISLPGLLPRHAEIRFENNRYYVLYDLSGGQTWVDGRPIQNANLLKNGFQVRVGVHELTFRQ